MSEHGAQQFRKGLFTPGLWRRLYDSAVLTVAQNFTAAQSFSAGLFSRHDGTMAPQTFGGNGAITTTVDGLWARINGRDMLMAEAGYAQAANNIVGGGLISWGGLVTFGGTGKLKWASRMMVIPCSALICPSGYLDFTMPTSNVLDGSGVNRADANGISLAAFEALFAVHLPGGTATQMSWVVRTYNPVYNHPPNWIMIASACADDGFLYLTNGMCLVANSSQLRANPYPANTALAQGGVDTFAYMNAARTKESVLTFAPKGQAEYWAYAAGAVSGSGATFTNVGSGVVVTTGANDRVIVTALGNLFGNQTNLRVVRDATQVLNINNEAGSYVFKAGQTIDIPGAGAHTYYLQINNTASATWGYQMPTSLVVEVIRQ